MTQAGLPWLHHNTIKCPSLSCQPLFFLSILKTILSERAESFSLRQEVWFKFIIDANEGMRLSGKLQMAKNRKHYCRPVLKSCDFHFGVGHLLEQRLGHGCAWAEVQRCTVPKSHVHACFKTPGICNCGNLKKKLSVIHALWLDSRANRSAGVGLSCHGAWKREDCKKS